VKLAAPLVLAFDAKKRRIDKPVRRDVKIEMVTELVDHFWFDAHRPTARVNNKIVEHPRPQWGEGPWNDSRRAIEMLIGPIESLPRLLLRKPLFA
jgi:hypothetical protein